MLDDLQKILYHKYLNGDLANLYMAQYDSSSTDADLWVKQFLTQLTTVEDHPDVLKVKKTEKENDYKVDSQNIKNLIKILNYRPIELKKIFIFLFDAHDLSVILSNKLLKVFEEIDPHFCLILMVPDNAVMLATVESRALKVKIESPLRSYSSKASLDFSKIDSPKELIQFLSDSTDENTHYKEKKYIENFIDQHLKKASHSAESFKNLEALLLNLRLYESATSFNNSKLARLSVFFG